MGARGPKPRSKAANKLAGNPGKRKPAQTSAHATSGPPQRPAWLSPVAAAEWDRVLPELEDRLNQGDMAALAAYCESVADLQSAIAEIAAEGATFTTDKGYVGQHPAVAQKAAAMARIKIFAREFGLTPASRGNVPQADAPPEADALGEFLDRGPGSAQ